MEPREFAHYLSCWLRPGVIAEALAEPQCTTEIVTISLQSTVFRSGYEANIPYLVSHYLKGFHVPVETIELLTFYDSTIFNESNVKLLRLLKFTGAVRFNKNEPVDSKSNTIVEIEVSLLQGSLIRWPLTMLLDTIANLSKIWSSLRLTYKGLVHHEPLSEWELVSYLDIVVAKYYGFNSIGKCGIVSDTLLKHIDETGTSCSAPLPVTYDYLMAIRATLSSY